MEIDITTKLNKMFKRILLLSTNNFYTLSIQIGKCFLMNMIYQKSEGFLHTDTIKILNFEGELQSKILRTPLSTNNSLTIV